MSDLAEQIARIIREAMWNSKDPKAAADQIIAIVREEAAKVCDERANERSAHPEWNLACWENAAAIRKLGSAS